MSNIIEIKEKLRFEDIFSGGKVKQIKWGEDFKEWPEAKQLNYAKQLASAMNQAADEMQKDRDRLIEACTLAESLRDEAYQSRDIAKGTLMQNITESNAEIHSLQTALGESQTRVKELENLLEA